MRWSRTVTPTAGPNSETRYHVQRQSLTLLGYALFGGVAILLGVGVLLFPTQLIEEASQSPHFAHTVREHAAATIFVRLMALWCIANYQRRLMVHLALLAFTILISAIHWFDYLNAQRPLASAVVNSVPCLLLLFVTPFDSISARAASSKP